MNQYVAIHFHWKTIISPRIHQDGAMIDTFVLSE